MTSWMPLRAVELAMPLSKHRLCTLAVFEALKRVSLAMGTRIGPLRDDYMCLVGAAELTHNCLSRLLEHAWLDDAVVNACLRVEQHRRGWPSEVNVLDSQASVRLRQSAAVPPRADAFRWLKMVRCSDLDFILLPYHEHDHWVLLVVEFHHERMEGKRMLAHAATVFCVNPYRPLDQDAGATAGVLQPLCDLLKRSCRTGMTLAGRDDSDAENLDAKIEFSVKQGRARELLGEFNLPSQDTSEDTTNCGVFTLLYVTLLFYLADMYLGLAESPSRWFSKEGDIPAPVGTLSWRDTESGPGSCPILIRNVRNNLFIELVGHGVVHSFDEEDRNEPQRI